MLISKQVLGQYFGERIVLIKVTYFNNLFQSMELHVQLGNVHRRGLRLQKFLGTKDNTDFV